MPNPNVPRERRTESLEQKVQLLRRAYASNRFDLVESLADSIKDSIQFDRQTAASSVETRPWLRKSIPTSALPKPWADWAEGWLRCKPIMLFETVGIERPREPVELFIGFDDDEITDPNREIRIARVEQNSTLSEVPSQILEDVRLSDGARGCRLAFLANVDGHSEATYLIFYGNPYAELPNYATDLETRGEQWKLEIENECFVARMSRQMGQLERLISKRQHGLELYAGGKGHGEPPTIDWAHDYVEDGGYQKLRMKNWAECRNFHVIRGPVCTQIRRWGFPRSPIHPLISPARFHIDVAYSFWSGLPTFFKESSMEALIDFRIEAMRDDEWVFSGYSYTKSLWIDASGKLHEGPVPSEHRENLWGVGFANETSRDAFIALWLEHEVNGRDQISHGGAPTLQYDGHGQLWSRYPAERTHLSAATTFTQRNAYTLFSWEDDAHRQVEQERHRWMNPLQVSTDTFQPVPRAVSRGRLARDGETSATAGPKDRIWKALRAVRDDQLYGVDGNIVDLGYVYDVRFRAGVASVTVTMPHRGRPVHEFLVTQGGGRVTEGIQERLMRVPGVKSVVVSLEWNPPWSLARLTANGRKAVGWS